MAKGVTYFVTDDRGHTYNRYSAYHGAPVYKYAAVTRTTGSEYPVGKGSVNYSETFENASKAGAGAAKTWRDGRTFEWQVYKVRAYRGRHKDEPKEGIL